MSELDKRLNKILGRVISSEFLSGRGLGKEIPFYAFDYDSKDELIIREHVVFLLSQISKKKPDLKIKHINLFELIIHHLHDRKFYEKVVKLQQAKGNDAVLSALRAPLNAQRIAEIFNAEAQLEHHDVVFMTGVGSSYPLLRIHSLLDNLQPLMGNTPLVFFYPGNYDKQSLRLFGELKDKPYYRAFRLID